MKLVITGANGFIAKNLIAHLERNPELQLVCVGRDFDRAKLAHELAQCDFVFHLAGVNRPLTDGEFAKGNVRFTDEICQLLKQSANRAPVLFSSSIQVERTGPYGQSKLAAERVLEELHSTNGNPVAIYRLPNVFGKWSRPNYNTVVATFCSNVANDLPLRIDNPATELSLVYIDDVIANFLLYLRANDKSLTRPLVEPVYRTTLAELAAQIVGFKRSRTSLMTERVGGGLERCLWATYLSFLEPQEFSYRVPAHSDSRGTFVEMLKTKDSGQFSYFTAHPGVTRGGHYHHTKTEKFLVVKGQALFRFHDRLSGRHFERRTDDTCPEIVESIPGWTHDITNIGSDVMAVMLWASEAFDRSLPDTYQQAIPNG